MYTQHIYLRAIPAIGKIPLNKLTQSDLQKFFSELQENGRLKNTKQKGRGLSDRTVNSCYAVIRMALDRAVQENFLGSNPVLGCKLPSRKSAEMKVLTKDEIRRFLIQAKEEGMYELFLLELTTGMRRGELLALRWDDLNFKTGELFITRQVYPVNGKLVISEPKTKAAVRSIILPRAMLEILEEYQKTVFSELMFPSRIKSEQPIDPGYVRKRLQTILNRAGCKTVRFHDLRHTFSTISLEHGMDIKTLSTVIGHVSAETTLNTYTHVTDTMRKDAARKIDRGIGKADGDAVREEPQHPAEEFVPQKPTRRRPGTGCVTQINDHLWEGRYSPKWPDGKKHPRNIYAHDEETCEKLLSEMILEVKREIAETREQIPAVQ